MVKRTFALLAPADERAVMKRFGAAPHPHGGGLLPPPPKPASGDASGALLTAHDKWYEAWISLRRKGIGASEVATINGVPGAYGSPFALWWQKKTGLRVEGDDTVMVMGTRLEAVIGEEWQARNRDAMLVRPGAGLYAHTSLRWLMCTPDFLAIVQRGNDPWPSVEPVECKAYDGGKGWGTPGTDQVPPHIKVQVIMQCEVLGATRGHVARMQNKRITSYTIDAFPDDEGTTRMLVQHWLTGAELFLRSLEHATPPPIDASEATADVLAHQYANIVEDERAQVSADLAAAYRLSLSDVREAQARLEYRKNLLRKAMGNAEFAVDPNGVVIAQRRHYKRSAFTVAAGEVDGIWPVGGSL